MKINPNLCAACGQCAEACPVDAIDTTGMNYNAYVIGPACIECESCIEVCPQGAIG